MPASVIPPIFLDAAVAVPSVVSLVRLHVLTAFEQTRSMIHQSIGTTDLSTASTLNLVLVTFGHISLFPCVDPGMFFLTSDE